MSRSKLITAYLEGDHPKAAQIRFAYNPELDVSEFRQALVDRFEVYCTAKKMDQFELFNIYYRVAGQGYFEIVGETEYEAFLMEPAVSLECIIVNRMVKEEEEKSAVLDIRLDEDDESENAQIRTNFAHENENAQIRSNLALTGINKELYKQALKVPYSFDGSDSTNFHHFKRDVIRHQSVYSIPDKTLNQILFGGQVVKGDAFDVIKLNWEILMALESSADQKAAVFDLLESHYGQNNLVTRYKQELFGLKQGSKSTRWYITEFAKRLNRLKIEVEVRNDAAQKEAYKIPNEFELGELLIANAGRYAKNFVIEKAMDKHQTVVLPYSKIVELFKAKMEREEVFSNFNRMRLDDAEYKEEQSQSRTRGKSPFFRSKSADRDYVRSVSNVNGGRKEEKAANGAFGGSQNFGSFSGRANSQYRRDFGSRQRSSNYKTLPCKFYPNCKKGKYCTFIHEATESKESPVDESGNQVSSVNHKNAIGKNDESVSNDSGTKMDENETQLDLFGQPIIRDVQNVKVTELTLKGEEHDNDDTNLVSKVLTNEPIRTIKVDIYGSDQYLVGFLDEGAQVSLCSEAVYHRLARFAQKPSRSIMVNGFDGSGKMTLNKMLSVPVAVCDFNVQTGKTAKLRKNLVLWMHPSVKYSILLGIDSQRVLNVRSCDMNKLKEILYKRYIKSDSFVVPNDEDVNDLFGRIEYRYVGRLGIYTFHNGKVLEYKNEHPDLDRLGDITQYRPLDYMPAKLLSSVVRRSEIQSGSVKEPCGVYYACSVGVLDHFGEDGAVRILRKFLASIFEIFMFDFLSAFSHYFASPLSVYDSMLIISYFYTLLFVLCAFVSLLGSSLCLISPPPSCRVDGRALDCYYTPVWVNSVDASVGLEIDGDVKGKANPLDFINYGDELTEHEVESIKAELLPMIDVFKGRAWDVGTFDVPPMKIRVKDEGLCQILPPFELSKTDEEILRNEVAYWVDRKLCRWMTANDVVLNSSPAFPAHRVLGKRDDGTKIVQSRVVVDFSSLNDNTVMFVHKNPSIEDIHAKISGYYRFNGTDIHKYFYHIPLDSDSQKYCGISVPDGILIADRVFQGLQNAPVYGHQLTSELFAGTDVITLQDDMCGGVELLYQGGQAVSQFDDDQKYFKSPIRQSKISSISSYDAPLREISDPTKWRNDWLYDFPRESRQSDSHEKVKDVNHVPIGGMIADYDATKKEGIRRFVKMIATAWKRGLKLNPKKTSCYVRELEFTGFSVTARGLIPLPRNTTKIFEFDYQRLRTKSDWLCFEGCCKFLNEYVLNLSIELAQLRDLMVVKEDGIKDTHLSIKEQNKRHYLRHSRESRSLFLYIQDKIKTTPILHHPDLTASGGVFIVKCDASLYGFGASLWQSRGKTAVLIKLYSRAFSPAQRNYAATEREALGFYLTLIKWKRYLLIKPFLCRGDCGALKSVYNLNHTKTKNPKLLRWIIGLQEYVFEFQHVAGDSLDIAVEDFISRMIVRRPSDKNVKPAYDDKAELVEIQNIALITQYTKRREPGTFKLYPLNALSAFIRSCNVAQFERLRKTYNVNCNPYMVSMLRNYRTLHSWKGDENITIQRSYYDFRAIHFCDHLNYLLVNISRSFVGKCTDRPVLSESNQRICDELSKRLDQGGLSQFDVVYIAADYLSEIPFKELYDILVDLFLRLRERMHVIYDVSPVLTRKQRKEICLECRVPVLSDDAHPQCDDCGQWVHLNCIPRVSKTTIFMLQNQPDLVRFRCRKCNGQKYDLHIVRSTDDPDVYQSRTIKEQESHSAEVSDEREDSECDEANGVDELKIAEELKLSRKYYLHTTNDTLLDIFAKQDAEVLDVFRQCQRCEYPQLIESVKTGQDGKGYNEFESQYMPDYEKLSIGEDGLLLFESRILVPTRLRCAIWLHYHKLSGHQNSAVNMTKKFYWHDVDKDVMVFLRQCPCKSTQIKQGYGVAGAASHSQYQPYLVTRPNQIVFLDIYGPLNGNRHLLVIVDCFDNYLQIICLKDTSALSVVRNILFQWIYVFGFIEQVVTDNGSNFVAKLNKLFYAMFDIKKRDIFEYSPWANLAEVYMKKINRERRYDLLFETVKLLRRGFVYDQLEKIGGIEIRNMDAFIKAIAFKHNNTPNYITGIAPNQFRINGPVHISVFDMYFKCYNAKRIATDLYVSKNVVDFRRYASLCDDQRRYLEMMIKSKKYLAYLKKYYANTKKAKVSFVKGDYVLYYPKSVEFAKSRIPYKYGWTIIDIKRRRINLVITIKNVFSGEVAKTNEKHIVKFHRPLIDPLNAMSKK